MAIMLYVGNLRYRVNHAELDALFAPFGKVKSARVTIDRDAGGFGLVEMSSPEEGRSAIEGLHHKDVGGRKLVVEDTEFLKQLDGMTKLEERCYFRDYAERLYTGQGEMVDLGCWLGATTIPLAIGLRQNPLPQAQSRIIRAYDTFVWYEFYEQFIHGTPLAGRLRTGESFVDEVQRRTAPWKERIQIVVGDLHQQIWSGEPVEFLLIDAMKDWWMANSIPRQFFPSLIPGLSIVVQQDFSFYGSPWIHLLMYRLREYFEPVDDVPESSSMVFRLRRPIPDAVLQQELSFATFSTLQIDEAFAYSRSLVAKAKYPAIEAARIMTFVDAKQLDRAKEMLRQYEEQGGAMNCWDIDGLRQAIDPALAPSAPNLGRLTTLYRRWRGRLSRIKQWLKRA